MKHYLLAASAAVLMVGAAVAGEGHDKSPMASTSFESLDKNADGRISATEANADKALNAGFSAADTNSDGALSKEEFAKWHTAATPRSEPQTQPDEVAPPQ